MTRMKVSASSESSAVAGAVAKEIRKEHCTELACIGVAAVNQLMKSVVLARSFLREEGIDIALEPEFAEVLTEEGIRSVFVARVYDKNYAGGQEAA